MWGGVDGDGGEAMGLLTGGKACEEWAREWCEEWGVGGWGWRRGDGMGWDGRRRRRGVFWGGEGGAVVGWVSGWFDWCRRAWDTNIDSI